MNFNITFLSAQAQEEFGEKFDPFNQAYITYIPFFTWEDVQNHGRLYEREIEQLHAPVNSGFQTVLQQRREFLHNHPSAFQLVIHLLLQDVITKYPSIKKYGFDMMVWFFATDRVNLLNGIDGVYDIYPRESEGSQEAILKYPFPGGPPCSVKAEVHSDDQSTFLGLLQCAIPIKVMVSVPLGEGDSIFIRWAKAIKGKIEQYPKSRPLVVDDDSRHTFIQFAFNNLLLWFCRSKNIPLPGSVTVSDEYEVTIPDGRAVQIKEVPRIEITNS
ncbi:MAG: hypothetical protein WC575_03910 [Patescibacteria group bacterium]